jgi:hypothetical protein
VREIGGGLAWQYDMGRKESLRLTMSLMRSRTRVLQPARSQKKIWVQRLPVRRVNLRVTC